MLAFNMTSMFRNELEDALGGCWDLHRFQQTVLQAGGRVVKHARAIVAAHRARSFGSLEHRRLLDQPTPLAWQLASGPRSSSRMGSPTSARAPSVRSSRLTRHTNSSHHQPLPLGERGGLQPIQLANPQPAIPAARSTLKNRVVNNAGLTSEPLTLPWITLRIWSSPDCDIRSENPAKFPASSISMMVTRKT